MSSSDEEGKLIRVFSHPMLETKVPLSKLELCQPDTDAEEKSRFLGELSIEYKFADGIERLYAYTGLPFLAIITGLGQLAMAAPLWYNGAVTTFQGILMSIVGIFCMLLGGALILYRRNHLITSYIHSIANIRSQDMVIRLLEKFGETMPGGFAEASEVFGKLTNEIKVELSEDRREIYRLLRYTAQEESE